MTEPQAGSDVKSLRTTARRDGDEWVLNGTKVFITNGGIADVHVVVATVDPELGHRGQASFVVGKGTPGLRQGKKESKIGIRASHTAEVVLEDCRIPVENLLGGTEKLERKLERARSGESSGRASNALATFELTRPIVGASALGIAQAAYEWTLGYLGNGAGTADPFESALDESSTAGEPPLRRQGNQQVLAQIATEIEAARLLVQRAAWMGRNGIPLTGGQGSMSKLKSGQVAVWVTRSLHRPRRSVRRDRGVPAREVVPRREDLRAVRRHRRDPAVGDLEDAGGGVPRPPARGRGDRRRGRRARPRWLCPGLVLARLQRRLQRRPSS